MVKRLAPMLIVAVVGLAGCSQGGVDPHHQDAETGRWYTKEQVALGSKVYRTNCASCHGKRAEATPDWRKSDAEGFYPPPPLNGTAHAWHHSYQLLFEIIRDGSRGRMPAWKDKLTDEEITAVIAWFQSQWPDRAYELWLPRNK